MNRVLVDTSVILDVFEDDPHWYEWSGARLTELGDDNHLLINSVIYAEVSIGFEKIEDVEAAIGIAGFEFSEIPREALFLAGKAFLNYRRQTGTKRSPLPDFFIGAHAAVEELPLLTRDTQRVQRYFPTVRLICPN